MHHTLVHISFQLKPYFSIKKSIHPLIELNHIMFTNTECLTTAHG